MYTTDFNNLLENSMKKKIVCALAVTLPLTVFAGWFSSDDKDKEKAAPAAVATGPVVVKQAISSSFEGETIKIETECIKGVFTDECKVTALESVGISSVNGGTDIMRRNAYIRAADKARAAVRHFIEEDITSTRVQNTMATNFANGAENKKYKTAGNVTTNEADADPESNSTKRGNGNETAQSVTESIRANAQGILRGFRVVKQEILPTSEAAVTIRWDLTSEMAAESFRKKFSF